MKFPALIRFLLRLCFRLTAHGLEETLGGGPLLLIPNHVSWIDFLFLYAFLDEDWRFVTSSTVARTTWIHQLVMVNERTFPVDTASPYSLREVAAYLQKGGRLALFAEGRISTTGSLMKVQEGTGFLVRATGAKVVTAYLRGAERVRFVRHAGWRRWFPRVSVHFRAAGAPPTYEAISQAETRRRLAGWLRDRMVEHQFQVEMEFGARHLPEAVAETAAAIPGRTALEDVSFQPLSYRRLMVGADALSGLWPTILGPGRADPVGVLLPNVNALPVVLLSLWTAGKIPTLLNFSSGMPTMLACARLAGLRAVVTSRAFLAKAKLDPSAFEAAGLQIHYMEEVRGRLSLGARLAALARNRLAPGRRLRQAAIPPESTAVILFTSGSEGVPKGVELTHRNLLANLRQVSAVIDVTETDRFFSALPMFHSFGIMAGTLFPLVRGCYTFLYPTPLHYRIVPALVYDRNCTVLLGTATFLNGYARRAHPYDFNTLRFLVAGAEKVQDATFETWARRFGVRILEGYGATECSPVISLNTRMEPRVGSAGKLLPGIECRLEPVEGVAEGGRLFVRGPNVMKGYLNPEANASFLAGGGWYDTGDVVHVDTEGFLSIKGRMRRFAKVGGEMVSLAAVEGALAGAFPKFGPRCEIAVLARSSDRKGEILIAATNERKLQLADLRAALADRGFNNLCVPRELHAFDRIPKLGSGKTDYRECLRQILERPAYHA